MIRAALKRAARIWPHRVIEVDGKGPYLLRVYLTPHAEWWRRTFPGVFLHRFYRSDADRELHNHPWVWAFSIILRGGYTEERIKRSTDDGVVQRSQYRPGMLNWIDSDSFHRVELRDEQRGCWSLFVAGPRFRDWGFLSRDGSTFETWYDREARIEREEREHA